MSDYNCMKHIATGNTGNVTEHETAACAAVRVFMYSCMYMKQFLYIQVCDA
jgi:hypothetical protein